MARPALRDDDLILDVPHLRVVPETPLIQPRLQHPVLDEHEVCERIRRALSRSHMGTRAPSGALLQMTVRTPFCVVTQHMFALTSSGPTSRTLNTFE